MQVGVITLFPEMFDALNYGVTGRAIRKGQLQVHCYNPRDYTHHKHRRVDDRPYGGGPGMVMAVQPLRDAIMAAKKNNPTAPTFLLSPQGQRLEQDTLKGLSSLPYLCLVAGRYEGVDQRLIELEVHGMISVGDYVLSGGELPAMLLIDAVARLLPGVLGNGQSALQDSFMHHRFDWPHYTKPAVYAGRAVPEVLLGGDHQAIARWRLKQSLGNTWKHRPDLLDRGVLTVLEQQLLQEFINEENTHESTH